MDQAARGIVNPQLLPGQAVAARNPDGRVISARIGIDLKRGNACGGRSMLFDRPDESSITAMLPESQLATKKRS